MCCFVINDPKPVLNTDALRLHVRRQDTASDRSATTACRGHPSRWTHYAHKTDSHLCMQDSREGQFMVALTLGKVHMHSALPLRSSLNVTFKAVKVFLFLFCFVIAVTLFVFLARCFVDRCPFLCFFPAEKDKTVSYSRYLMPSAMNVISGPGKNKH